jgi:hypothetical protein
MPPAEFARSGFHSGETASGYFDEALSITIDGVDRTRKSEIETLNITEQVGNRPARLLLSLRNVAPDMHDEIKIFNGGVDVGVPIFCGHVMAIRQRGLRAADRPTYEIEAVDYSWKLNTGGLLVTRTYRGVGVGTIVADILGREAPIGFTLGYCPSSLGTIDEIVFYRNTPGECFQRLADTIDGAVYHLDYSKRVHIFTTAEDEDSTLIIASTSTDVWDFDYREDGSDIATFIMADGGGGVTTARIGGDVADGVTFGSIPVDETGWYDGSSYTLQVGMNAITGGTRSVASGGGTLTHLVENNFGRFVDTAISTPVTLVASALDPLTGYGSILKYVKDGRLGRERLQALAAAQLAKYKVLQQTVTFTTHNMAMRPGRKVILVLTTPRVVAGTLMIQQVRTKSRHKEDGTRSTLKLDRTVTATTSLRTLVDALADSGVR